MNRDGKRKAGTAFDALDTPKTPLRKPFIRSTAHNTVFSIKLRSLLDQERYQEAKLLFTEMVKSTRYDFKNLWQAGIEVIGKASPNELAGYLEAVYTGAPPSLKAETFNVYMDQLILEEKYSKALEDMEFVYHRSGYHHPILLRKMAICAYNLWKSAYEKLPEEYFEDEDFHDQHDITHIRYRSYLHAASKYLASTHNTYLRDSELYDIYFSFLDKIGNEEEKKNITLRSLEAFDKDPEYYLLFDLMKRNQNNIYFNNQDYIIPLYEFNPFLKPEVKGLCEFCKQFTIELKALKEDEEASEEDINKKTKLAIRIIRLFVTRIEHGNVEAWFCNRVKKICKIVMCQEIEDIYFYYNVDNLLRTEKVLQSPEAKKITKFADDLNEMVADYISKYGRRSVVNTIQSVREIQSLNEEEEEAVDQLDNLIKEEVAEEKEEQEKKYEEEEAEEEAEEEEEEDGSLYLEGESFYTQIIDSSDENEDEDEDEDEDKANSDKVEVESDQEETDSDQEESINIKEIASDQEEIESDQDDSSSDQDEKVRKK